MLARYFLRVKAGFLVGVSSDLLMLSFTFLQDNQEQIIVLDTWVIQVLHTL